MALGAAVQAGNKSGQLLKQQLIATDVAPFAMGIAVLKVDATDRLKPGGFQKIIDRNTTIPVRKSEPFTTCCDGQTTVSIEVYQGEDEWVEHNHFLGEFLVDGIPPAPAGMEGINVSFFYNINGILEVTAELESTGKKVIVNMRDELQRDSMEIFRASVKKIEALLETKTAEHLNSHTQMSFIDAFDFEDEKDFGYPDLENQDLEVLKQELEQLRTDLSGRINVDENQILELIEAAITTQERSAMIEAIEEATDLLIKLNLD